MKYNIVVCGGTFDHFHKGHREFLRFCLSVGNKLLLGLTTDRSIANKDNNGIIENYRTRKKQVEDFLTKEKAIERVTIEPIDDVYVPKIWEFLPIEAIIVSKNTIGGANKINIKRQEQKKYPLVIEIVPLVKNENNEYISSSKIRNGEIDREGKPYLNPYWLKHDLQITKDLRKKLKKPFGELIKSEHSLKDLEYLYLITVGDITTATFNKLGFKQDISAIDFHVARKKVFSDIRELGFLGKQEIVKVSNPPGHLTSDLFKGLLRLFTPYHNAPIVQKVLLVKGEEDLCVLPLTLGSPLNCVIFYGQPNEGMVKVEVSEETKRKAYRLVSKFSVCTRGH